jgi:hypothetical protein
MGADAKRMTLRKMACGLYVLTANDGKGEVDTTTYSEVPT